MSRTVADNQALRLFALALLSVLCRAQTLSIISQAPTPVLSSSSHFTPNGPSSSFDSLGTGLSTTPSTTIFGLSEPTFPPTMTSCFIPPSGTVVSRKTLDPSASTQPAYAECIEIIHTSDHVIEVELFTVAEDGSTLLPSNVASPSGSSSSSSSGSSIGAGAIAGIVVGAILGTLIIGTTAFWVRKQRRSAKPVANWINRPAGWVRDEKQQLNVIELSRRDRV